MARRCATPSPLTVGPTLFLTAARKARQHPTSARPKASSAWRSRPRAASAVWPRRHPCRRTWPSRCKASPPRRRPCAPDPPSSPRPRAPSKPLIPKALLADSWGDFPNRGDADSRRHGGFAPCHQRSDCERIIRLRSFGRWPGGRRTSTRAGGCCRWLRSGTAWTEVRRRLSSALCRKASAQARLLAHERQAAPSGAGREGRRGFQKNFPRALKAHLEGLPETTPVEIWFEML